MTTSKFFLVIILLVVTILIKSNALVSAQSLHPNIIFIIADDLGWDQYGNYRGIHSKKARTPTIDSLARNGITFTNFWVNPVCSPTRACMLTGKYGFRTNVGGTFTRSVLQPTETVIQKYISDKTSNAYATAVIGKWHVSGMDLNAPEKFGVQYYSGIIGGGVGGREQNYYKWLQISGGKQQTITTYTTTHFVNQSINWIQQQSKPFFLWLAFNAPHTPFHRPPLNLITDHSLVDNPDTMRARPLPYSLAAIEAMDNEIARLIESLTPAQKSNTIFIFMGDNGSSNWVAQAPYLNFQSKNSLYQGGVNTPLVVCGKSVKRKNAVESALVQAPDMFATFADITGTGISKYEDGISIKPLFTNANTTKRKYVYTELFGQDTAAKTPDGKMIPNPNGYAIRNIQYKLIHLENSTKYFYNLITDPFEQLNLLSAPLSADAKKNLKELIKIKGGL